MPPEIVSPVKAIVVVLACATVWSRDASARTLRVVANVRKRRRLDMVILLHRPAQPAESVGDINPFSQGPPQRDTAFALLLGAAEGSSCIPGCIGMVSEASNTIRARTENNANPVVGKGVPDQARSDISAPVGQRRPGQSLPPQT